MFGEWRMRECPQCGHPFTPQGRSQRFCTVACYNDDHLDRHASLLSSEDSLRLRVIDNGWTERPDWAL